MTDERIQKIRKSYANFGSDTYTLYMYGVSQNLLHHRDSQHSFLFISQRKRSISQNFDSFSHSKNATFEGMSRRASERNLLKYLGNLICSKNF